MRIFEGLPFLLEREEEIWTPLFGMCHVFCPDRRTEIERVAADICAGKRAEPKTVSSREAKASANALCDGERLVRDLREICGDQNGIRTSEALRQLREIHHAPWRNYAGEGLTDMKLAELVRRFGVAPRQFKVDGRNQRGYLRVELADALKQFAQPATPLPEAPDKARRDAS